VGGLFQLVLASWLFRGAVVHIFAPDGAQAYLLVATKTRPGILDFYDTCSGFTSSPGVWRWCEREAMRLADGITHRDLRGKYLQKLHGYRLPRHNILIHDPLLEDRPCQLQFRNDGQIRVVSVGWTGRGDNSVLRTIRALCANRIHVHIYGNPVQRHVDSEADAYLQLQQESEYFHIEAPVFGEAYWEQLSRYDFGLAVFEPLVFGEQPAAYTLDYLLGCGSSRAADYIQMDLGVILSPGLKFHSFLLHRYATAVVLATHEFLQNPRPILESALHARSLARRKDLFAISTRGVGSRLGRFYSRVAAGEASRWSGRDQAA